VGINTETEQKSLQFRTQQGTHGEGSFHGHAKNDEKAKTELLQFFRAIDRGLLKILHNNQTPPMIVACLDYLFPIYKEANSYQNLYPQHISGNPADMDSLTLHEKAWELLKSHFNRKRHDKKEQYQELHKSGKTSSDLKEILTAAEMGKIDTLFIERNGEIFGNYNNETKLSSATNETNSTGIPLLNFAALKVFEQGGKVFLEDTEHLPDASSKINALFRY